MKTRKSLFALFILVCVICSLLFSLTSVSATDYAMHRDYFTDYDAYLAYVAEGKHIAGPDSFVPFVPFDHFHVLGNFRSAYFQQYLLESYYEYGFTDENGYELQLWIQYTNRNFLPGKDYILFPGEMEDMTALGVNKSGSLIRGPLQYLYEDGQLTCIMWKEDNIRFALYSTTSLHDYPLDKADSITKRLLSPDKAVALDAIAELTALTPKSPQFFNGLHIRFLLIFLTILIPPALIIPALLKRIRFRKWVKKTRYTSEDFLLQKAR